MTRASEPTIIDLENVTTLLGEAQRIRRDLDGVRVEPGNNRENADVKRDLLYLSDTLTRAAAEARTAYHALNGRPDPLES